MDQSPKGNAMDVMDSPRLAIVGLGYVGLPLAVEFSKHFPVTGFDINPVRIKELREGHDRTREVAATDLANAAGLHFTSEIADINACTIYIVTVPTPVDDAQLPDLRPLLSASKAVGSVLKAGDIVVYESTVFPGCTEEVCVPVLEESSGLVFNKDFYAGYSPERVNPGDKRHRLADIVKVTSGSTPEVAEFLDNVYGRIITAGTHKASSIRVAEAAKVIENTQRDLNIALVNDLAILFNQLNIDTLEVLEAAGTKWNFLPFRPGLVGGHCIGVDPYYLTYKAQQVGHHPDVILAGRRTNDGMGAYVANETIRLMLQRRLNPVDARILILGLAFKENCPDLRNTRVVDIIEELKSYNATVDVFDPHVDVAEAQQEYSVELLTAPPNGTYDAIIVAVAHDEFQNLGPAGIRAYGKSGSVIYDVKGLLPKDEVDGRL